MNVFNKIRNGLSYSNVAATMAVVLGLSGTAYATGATEALEGSGTRTVGFQGHVEDIPTPSSEYVFAGPTAQVAVDGDDRLTGSASAPLAVKSDNNIRFSADVGLCYQRVPARGMGPGRINNFVGPHFATSWITNYRATYSASATKHGLAAGMYDVGMCVRSGAWWPIGDNGRVNGWVTVSDD